MDREDERKLILDIPKDKLADFIFMHLRNYWAVDGLYYIKIEEEYGTEVATEIDRRVWEVMGKIEAKKLKDFFELGDDITSLMKALSLSAWALDLENKEIVVEKNRGIIRNTNCRIQNTRLKKGLVEFGCKTVRYGFMKAFAKEFNKDIKVNCNVCPPDKHPNDLWCEWEFVLD